MYFFSFIYHPTFIFFCIFILCLQKKILENVFFQFFKCFMANKKKLIIIKTSRVEYIF